MPSDLREVDRMKDVPDALNKIVDVVLAYRPKPRTKAARKRAKAQKVKDDERAKISGPGPTSK